MRREEAKFTTVWIISSFGLLTGPDVQSAHTFVLIGRINTLTVLCGLLKLSHKHKELIM